LRGCANRGWRAKSQEQERPVADGADAPDHHCRPRRRPRGCLPSCPRPWGQL